MFRRILKEPLVHFLILSAAVFLLAGVMRDPVAERPDQIVITAAQIQQLMEGFSRTWNRPPTAQEAQGLINDHIKEEIFYREAQALGLDRDDTIVRRRMRQKLDFLSEDLVRVPDLTDEQLQNFLETHADQFQIGTKLSFSQIFFNADRRGESVQSDAEQALAKLALSNGSTDSNQLGDPFLLALDSGLVSEEEVARLFGSEFASELLKIQPNK